MDQIIFPVPNLQQCEDRLVFLVYVAALFREATTLRCIPEFLHTTSTTMTIHFYFVRFHDRIMAGEAPLWTIFSFELAQVCTILLSRKNPHHYAPVRRSIIFKTSTLLVSMLNAIC